MSKSVNTDVSPVPHDTDDSFFSEHSGVSHMYPQKAECACVCVCVEPYDRLR